MTERQWASLKTDNSHQKETGILTFTVTHLTAPPRPTPPHLVPKPTIPGEPPNFF